MPSLQPVAAQPAACNLPWKVLSSLRVYFLQANVKLADQFSSFLLFYLMASFCSPFVFGSCWAWDVAQMAGRPWPLAPAPWGHYGQLRL